MNYKPNKNELKKRLTKEQFKVTQKKGTEAPFSGKYDDFTECLEQKLRVQSAVPI